MLYEPLDFNRITRAIEGTHKLVEGQLEDSISTMNLAISEAHNNVMDAMSYATSIDKKFLKYTSN